MNPALLGIWEHMRELGLGALAHANRHAAYTGMLNMKWPELSVLQAAHAAELLIKARIAQEHPLLIFEQMPRSTQAIGVSLDLPDLFQRGRTVQWQDLPERLWAATGLTIPEKSRFDAFGRLRNGIQHFLPSPDGDHEEETLRFIFEVVDPFIYECWGLCAIDYDEDHEPYVYFVGALTRREILFNVSTEAAQSFEDWDVDWCKVSTEYRDEIHRRVQLALSQSS